MEIFLWGHIESLIYTSPIHSEEDLIARIVEAAATIMQHPGFICGHMSNSAASLLVVYRGQ
jgi:hypothetical protein